MSVPRRRSSDVVLGELREAIRAEVQEVVHDATRVYRIRQIVLYVVLFAAGVGAAFYQQHQAGRLGRAVQQINVNRAVNAQRFAMKDRQLCRVTSTLLDLQVRSTKQAVPLFRPLFAEKPEGFAKAIRDSHRRVAKLRTVRNGLRCDTPVRLR